MPTKPNLALRDFLQGEYPVTTEILWLRIATARRWSPWPDLPADADALQAELQRLAEGGYVELDGESWRMVYPQPREVKAGEQAQLFS